MRRLREQVRHRVKLGRMRKNVKNRIRGVLYKRRIKLEVNPFT